MNWTNNIIEFCRHYNIPLNFLAETLNEPKVVPMIRGKAFEFSVFERLQEILNSEIWLVEKPMLNPQFGIHDEDVRIKHIESQKTISIECKLAAKGRFSKLRNGGYTISVKCMRSRTLGDARIAQLAPLIGVSESVLKVHNDQYVPSDFDMVITSIGNAFYETNPTTDMFEWSPNTEAVHFLKAMFNTADEDLLKDLTFNKMYVITSEKLAIKTGNWHTCTRRNCTSPQNCGFIPNYPKINYLPFQNGNFIEATNGWVTIENIESLLMELVS